MFNKEQLQGAVQELQVMVEFLRQQPNNPLIQAFLKYLELRREVNKECMAHEEKEWTIRQYQGAVKELEGIVSALTSVGPSVESDD